MNPLFQQMQPPEPPMMQQLRGFMQNFRGDPRQQVQQLLNSGRISQAQYDNAVRMANQLSQMFRR